MSPLARINAFNQWKSTTINDNRWRDMATISINHNIHLPEDMPRVHTRDTHPINVNQRDGCITIPHKCRHLWGIDWHWLDTFTLIGCVDASRSNQCHTQTSVDYSRHNRQHVLMTIPWLLHWRRRWQCMVLHVVPARNVYGGVPCNGNYLLETVVLGLD